MKGRCLGAGGTENHDKTKTEVDLFEHDPCF